MKYLYPVAIVLAVAVVYVTGWVIMAFIDMFMQAMSELNERVT